MYCSLVMHKGEERMKVFISWSGDTSFEVAKILKEWIPCVIQDVQPYFSSEDIDKGARWSTDIAKELESASFGILCVTKDNLESQWLNFEAGALSKAIDKSKVCPLLFRLKPSDISDSPILQFQMTNVEKNDIYKLFKSINASLEDAGLDEARLEKVFNTFWPQMEQNFNSIKDPGSNNESKKEKDDRNMAIFEEMLDLLRSQQMMLKNPEKILPMDYVDEILVKMQRETERLTGSRIPPMVIMDVERSEMELNRMLVDDITELNEEAMGKIKECVEKYVMNVRRLRKCINARYSVNTKLFL